MQARVVNVTLERIVPAPRIRFDRDPLPHDPIPCEPRTAKLTLQASTLLEPKERFAETASVLGLAMLEASAIIAGKPDPTPSGSDRVALHGAVDAIDAAETAGRYQPGPKVISEVFGTDPLTVEIVQPVAVPTEAA